MKATKKEREEILLRIIDLAKTVRDRGVDPFEVEVRELFDRLHELLPKIRDPQELYLDILAVLGLSDIVYQQGEWIKHKSSLLYFDPLLVLWKLRSLSTNELAHVMAESWHPIVGLECIAPHGIKESMDYWNTLPSLEERRAGFDVEEIQAGEMARKELERLGLMERKDFTQTLERTWEELKKAAGGSGKVQYWDFVDASSFEETVIRAWLVSFLVSYGYATLELKPLEEEIILKPLKSRQTAHTGAAFSVPVPVTLDEWKGRRTKSG